MALHAENCQITMPPVRTRPEYKNYQGHAGIREWVGFSDSNLEFQDFQVVSLAVDPADAGMVRGKFSSKLKVLATGKQLPEPQVWNLVYTIADGKLVKYEFDFGDVGALEDVWGADEAEANIATVGSVLEAWGNWADDDGAACLALFTEDCECTVPPVPSAGPGALYGRTHRGHAGVREWVEFIDAELDFAGYEVAGITADPTGAIRLESKYQPTVKATGRKCVEAIKSEASYRVERGKIAELHLPAWGAKFEAMYE